LFGERQAVPSCPVDPSYVVDTAATLAYSQGVDAGYYISYAGAGHWHFEWTCDTRLSADGCNFTGTVVADTPTGGLEPSCFECEPQQDILTTTPEGRSTAIDFDTITTTGIDGIDFTTTPGSSISIDLQINGLYQNDLVYVPSGGAVISAECNPAALTPSSP
jgi:hypothetical protein